MNRHWVTLEYPVILKRLAEHTEFSGGEDLALALEPVSIIEEARERLALTGEARDLLEVRATFTVGGVRDIRPLAEQAEHGVTLQPTDLLRVRDTLRAGARVRRILTGAETRCPGLADIAWRIQTPTDVAEHIERVLDDRAQVRDNASAELSRIRRELDQSQERIQNKLQRMLGSSRIAPYLQEALITRREGRFVLPVRSDSKGRVEGIVHDRSGSGVTLFVEPLDVVELNNALRELRLAEEEEIFRLLAELTAHVAHEAEAIRAAVAALSEVDLVFAKARYAEDLEATAPELHPVPKKAPESEKLNNEGDLYHPGTVVRLHGARHPLLRPEEVVKVDLVLDEATHVLVITGPNTGGKTVSLKTVGLLTLMAQAGMHLPVESGSALSCFEAVYADIGDEQSIEQSLSTFSSHMTNILSFMNRADHRALVLLDELGAGTDPTEGAALARSMLEAFRERRCTAFVATHYSELKLYAHHTPGVANASMAFDVETLAPTYKLSIGVPGRSNAFAIARRLGMPQEVIKRAQGMLSGEELRAEDMLDDLHQLRIQEARARDAAWRDQREARDLASELRERLRNIEKERREVLRQAEETAEAELAELRSEIATLRRKLRTFAAQQAMPELDEVAQEVQAAKTKMPKPTSLTADLPAPPAPRETETPEAEAQADPIREGEISPGDRVRLPSLGMEGIVTDIEDEEAEIQAGAIRTRVDLEDLELLERKAEVKSQTGEVNVPERAASPGIQLDLRGQVVEEALQSLERYLEQAVMAQLPWVRVVHGKGTGALRRAVRDYLQDHPAVVEYKDAPQREGGFGATVVDLV
ncbi:MAG: endonuclease MutS2 [Anaerolineales bacterium]